MNILNCRTLQPEELNKFCSICVDRLKNIKLEKLLIHWGSDGVPHVYIDDDIKLGRRLFTKEIFLIKILL